MKSLIFLIIFFTIAGCTQIQTQNQSATAEQQLSDTPLLCFEENCFKYETALSVKEQRTGLMYRDSLEQDNGLLFPFSASGTPGFWMKNVKFPIDIVWLSEDFEIVDISNNLPPCSQEPCRVYRSSKEANYAFEINAGLSNEFGLVQGIKAVKK